MTGICRPSGVGVATIRAAVALVGLDEDAAHEALARLAARDGDSPWTAAAILSGAGANPLRFLSTLAACQPGWLSDPTPVQARFLSGLAETVAARDPDTDRREVVRRYQPALSLVGDVPRGRTLFEKHCMTCHARDGRGAKVGPDLVSVAGRPKEDLLVAILDPAREAAPDGQGVVVSTTTGQTLTGLLSEARHATP